MAKKVLQVIKLQIPAGAASPAPPVGPALGGAGVNIMEFCKAFNAQTQSGNGTITPVEVTVYEAPTARRLWTGRFDETQQAITEAILRARQYPGGGTRWLSAPEFARWGADEVAKSITALH